MYGNGIIPASVMIKKDNRFFKVARVKLLVYLKGKKRINLYQLPKFILFGFVGAAIGAASVAALFGAMVGVLTLGATIVGCP